MEAQKRSADDRAARPRLTLIGCAVAAAYVLFARLGFRLAFVATQVTIVWPPTGIAQAALLLWGRRLWPAVWIAAFVVNVTPDVPVLAAAAIATGNTLEAVAAAWAFTRFGFNPALDKTRDMLAFMMIGVAASTAIGATVGAATLCGAGLQPWQLFGDIWSEWWLGDAIGSLVVAPLLLTTLRSRTRLSPRQAVETAGWVVASVAGTSLVFGRRLGIAGGQFPLAFAIFPFVIGAAVRLGHPATALVIVATVAVTLWSTIYGSGPFMGGPAHQALVLAQVFTGVLAGSGLLLAAAITERRVIERRRSATYAVGEVLASSESLAEAAPRILAAIGGNLDWQAGAVWIVDRRRGRLRCVSTWLPPEMAAPRFIQLTSQSEFARGVGLPGRVWATGRAVWIRDVVEDPNFPRAPVAREEGLHGAFGFPISAGVGVLGVVEFFNRSVEAPDTDLLATMAAIGNEIGQFMSRKQNEAATAESQSRTRAILESALDAIISMDHRGTITEFNPAAERMFGCRREDVLGRELADTIIPASLREAHRQGMQGFLVRGEGRLVDRRLETTAVRRDGTEFPVEVSIARVSTDPPLFTGFIRDLTARVAADRERALLLERELRAREQAEAANRAKDVFLATLSHELRTPLNAIVGWARMLVDGTLDGATAKRALQIIDRNAQVQLQLVEDILDVSRIVTGKLSLDIQPVDVGAIVGAVLESVRPAAEAKQVRIHSKLSASSRVIAADPKRLQQIVWNLISNALKFTGPGGRVEVEVLDGPASSVCIKVVDDGVGIAPEFLPHLFERFTQADSSTTRQHGGLGLGLAIVRHLVELHGGTIRAESRGVGQGAAFVVELPRVIEPAGHSAGTGAVGPTRSGAPLSGCRVLVVDDEADARDLLSAILGRAGAAVELAPSAEQAIAKLSATQPDVLLSDIGLPGQDGYALIRQVRAREAGRPTRLPCAAITAYAHREDRRRAREAGFDLHVTKPIDATIVEAVRALWRQQDR